MIGKYVIIDTLDNFKAKLDLIPSSAIVLIKDVGQIYAHGTYFGAQKTYSLLTKTADGLAPKGGTSASSLISNVDTEWVLTVTNGKNPTWRKLPANAFSSSSYTLSSATTSDLGGIKVGQVYTATFDDLVGLYYKINIDKNGLAYVHVPWINNPYTASGSGITLEDNVFSLSLNSVTKLDSAIGNKIYAVSLDKNGKLCVSVPWTDTNNIFVGATETKNGSSGMVPAPIANQHRYFLRGDRTWVKPNLSDFTDDVVNGKYLPLAGGTMDGVLTLNYANTNSRSYIRQTNGRAIVNGGGWAVNMYSMTNNDGDVLTQIGAYGTSEKLEYMYIGSNGYNGACLRIYPTHVAFGSTQIALLNSNVASADYASSAGNADKATYTDLFSRVATARVDNTYDLNEHNKGMVYSYNSSEALINKPSGMSYGQVLALNSKINTFSLCGQLAWDVNHSSTTDTTRGLWWRAADSTNNFAYSQWHQIAFTDSNVASATKLKNARTIWGQSFDGTGNISGALTLPNAVGIHSIDANGNSNHVLLFSSSNVLNIGGGSAVRGHDTRIFGDSIYFAYSGSRVDGIVLNSLGNVGIGNTAPAYKLDVTGSVYASYSTNNAIHIGAENDVAKVSLYAAKSGNHGVYSSTKSNWLLYTDGTNTMIPFGNVGIGKTPSYKLDVNGTFNASSNASIGGTLSVSGATTLQVLSATSGRFSSTLNIDGTTISNALIRIYNSDKTYRSMFNYNDTDANTLRIYNITDDGQTFGAIKIGKTDGTQLYLKGNGYVGIGTTDPKYKLHVSGIIKGTTIFSTNSFLNPGGNGIYFTGSGIFYHDTNDAWVSDLITFDSKSVNLHQNTSCLGTLTVTSDSIFKGNTTNRAIAYFANGTAYYINASGAAKFASLTSVGAISGTNGTFSGQLSSQSLSVNGGSLTYDSANKSWELNSRLNVNRDSVIPLYVINTTSNATLSFLRFSTKTNGYLASIGSTTSGYLYRYNSNLTNLFKIWDEENFNPSDYLPISGGTINGQLAFNHNYGANANIIFKNNRLSNSQTSNSADNVILINDATDTTVGRFGVYGITGALSYIYIGLNAYNGNNFRIYSDKVTFGNSTIIHSGNIGSQSVSYASSAGDADTIDSYHISNGFQYLKRVEYSDSTNSVWYVKVVFNVSYNSIPKKVRIQPGYNNTNGVVELEIGSYMMSSGYIAKVCNYNNSNCTGFWYGEQSDNSSNSSRLTLYLRFKGGAPAHTYIYSQIAILESSKVSTSVGSSKTYVDLEIDGQQIVHNYRLTATALSSSAGSSTNPIYFSGGKPVACTYSLNKTVPSDAIFTDTKYTAGKGLILSDSNEFSIYVPRVIQSCNDLPGRNKFTLKEYQYGEGYNLPSLSYYHIYTSQGLDVKYATQLALGMTAELAYYRVYYNGTWKDWHSIINTDTTYSAGTGISISGTTISNSGVRSISAGSANGTISVNTGGTSADVSVTGLGSLAFKSSIDKLTSTTGTSYNGGLWVKVVDSQLDLVGNTSNAGAWSIPSGSPDAHYGNGTILRLGWSYGLYYTEIYTGPNVLDKKYGLYWRQVVNGSVKAWKILMDTDNYNYYVPKLDGTGATGTWGISISGNATTATKLATSVNINGTSFNGASDITTSKWGTSRSITIGNTAKSVDGSGNVSWSSNEIGYHYKWWNNVKVNTWSRLCFVNYEVNVIGCKFLLNVSGTRNSVVFNDLYAITAHHSKSGNIVKLCGSHYSTGYKLRILSNSSGSCYVEMYDNLLNPDSITYQSVYCRLIPIFTGAITLYESYTAGSIPSGYNEISLTLNSYQIQGSINASATDGYSISVGAAGTDTSTIYFVT